MAKVNKETMWRMEGMIFAYNVGRKACEEKGEPLGTGVMAIKEDIKKRGFFKAPMKFTQKQIEEWIGYLSKNLYNTMSAAVLMTLHDEFDFGKVRIRRFKDRFDEKVRMTTNFDFIGEHYTTLGEYVEYLNNKYDFLDLDMERVEDCQNNYSGEQLLKGKADIKSVIDLLKEEGEVRAAKLLEERITA